MLYSRDLIVRITCWHGDSRARSAVFICAFGNIANVLEDLARNWPPPEFGSAPVVETWKRAHPSAVLSELKGAIRLTRSVTIDEPDPKSWLAILDCIVDRSEFFEVECLDCAATYPKAVLRFRDIEEHRGPRDGYAARLLECPESHVLHRRVFWVS